MLEKKLFGVYHQYGMDVFLRVCTEMLGIKDSDNWDKKRHINGEVCEVVLTVITENYFSTHGVKSKGFRSLIFEDYDHRERDFCTEVDFLALTPGVALVGECKSFAGDVIVTDRCTLNRADFKADVAQQCDVHAKAMQKYLRDVSIGGDHVPPFGMFCFVYSRGTLVDKRNKEDKQRIPVLTLDNIEDYLGRVVKQYTQEEYDFEKARAFFKQNSESKELHDKHRAYLGY